MRVGVIGTGAISYKHALAYKNIGFPITACTNRTADVGRIFAEATGAEFVDSVESLCRRHDVDFVDVCTSPSYRLQAVELCASAGKHVIVQKPMAIDLESAQQMIDTAKAGRIQLAVMSSSRFLDSISFLRKAILADRLGKILQADAYIKWYRPAEYYNRPHKGTWNGEGGGALINQGIHCADLLLYLAGAVTEVFGFWQIGSTHSIESEDSISAVLRYASGATGVIQASTSIWPGYAERLEISGTKGTAMVTGGSLTTWDVLNDAGEDAPITSTGSSGASDPMAISVLPFERQFLDFAVACDTGTGPLCSGDDGYRALQLVTRIYDSCRQGSSIRIESRL
jgi:UDP-N-acetyl-2-amino-2-deoxyglucuronate dehydrogenase